MNKRKRLAAIVAFAAMLLTSCTSISTPSSSSSVAGDVSSPATPTVEHGMVESTAGLTDFSTAAVDYEPSLTTDQEVLIADTDFAEAAAYIPGTTIVSAGKYLVTGEIDQAIIVNAPNDTVVQLFLSNASVSSSENAPIVNTNKKSTLVVTLLPDTVNHLTNSASSEDSTADANGLRVKGNLLINGSGSLAITAPLGDAIKVSKSFVVADSALTLSAEEHGIEADGLIYARSAAIAVQSQTKDGLHVEIDTDSGQTEFTKEEGFVYLDSTTFSYSGPGDGIQGNSFVYVKGGTLDIATTGTFVPDTAANRTAYDLDAGDFRYTKSESHYVKVDSDYRGNETLYALAQSAKAIRNKPIEYEDENGLVQDAASAEYLILLVDVSEAVLNAQDDAVNSSGGSIAVFGSSLTIDSYDQGFNADRVFQSSGSTIDIKSSYEGIQAQRVELAGGIESSVSIIAADDGLNAASDDFTDRGILVNGGYLSVLAGGDGLDSNGWLSVNGGITTVQASTANDNSALDSDDAIEINGGVIGAFGSLGMVETPTSASAQNTLVYGYSSGLAAGADFTVSDGYGTVLFAFVLANTYESAIVSVPEFATGSTYSISTGETKLTDFTISSVISSVGDSSRGNNPGGGHDGR